MIADKFSNIIVREKYGWKEYYVDNIVVWFCGYLYNSNIENFLKKVSQVISKKFENETIIDLVNGTNGHFAFIVESSSFVIASVDKVCSIPLFYGDNNEVLVSNYAPFLKHKYKAGDDNLDIEAKLEIFMSGFTIGNKTLYRSIKRLESGECLIFSKRCKLLYVESYYQYSPWKIFNKSEGELHEEFTSILLKIFRQISDNAGERQIVIPLSAGNDSRLIASALKKVGAKNVICYSYGRKGSFEIPIAKSIAYKLGYKWIYIQDRLKEKRRFFQSKTYSNYIDAFESYSYTHNIQEVYEVFLLKRSGLINNDAIIINGNSGDFISGGHVKSISKLRTTPNTIDEVDWSKFLNKHYSLWKSLRRSNNDKYIISELKKIFIKNIGNSIHLKKDHYAIMEYFEFIGRQSKIVIGQQRTYEYFDYEWVLPFWSDEMLKFWEAVPLKYKIDQCLYLKILRKNDWGGVWLNIKVNDKIIYPVSLRWLRIILKAFFIPFGKSSWHRFEKNVLEYFLHSSYPLTVVPYLDVLFDMRGYRGANSWLSRKMLQSINKVK